MTYRSWIIGSAAVAAIFVVGCANGPSPSSPSSARVTAGSDVAVQSATGASAQTTGKPDYEQAYYNGTIVTMNHIEVPQNPGVLAHVLSEPGYRRGPDRRFLVLLGGGGLLGGRRAELPGTM